MIRRFILYSVGIFCFFLVISAPAWGQSEAFEKYLHDDGDGANFDQAILLKNTSNFSSCDTWECAEKIFNEDVFKGEVAYVTEYVGQPEVDWTISGHKEVTAYLSSDSRYYDDLDIQINATGKNQALIFDITSCVDALKDKEEEIDPNAAAAKWAPDPIWPIEEWD